MKILKMKNMIKDECDALSKLSIHTVCGIRSENENIWEVLSNKEKKNVFSSK
jgi:hypothetical protein